MGGSAHRDATTSTISRYAAGVALIALASPGAIAQPCAARDPVTIGVVVDNSTSIDRSFWAGPVTAWLTTLYGVLRPGDTLRISGLDTSGRGSPRSFARRASRSASDAVATRELQPFVRELWKSRETRSDLAISIRHMAASLPRCRAVILMSDGWLAPRNTRQTPDESVDALLALGESLRAARVAVYAIRIGDVHEVVDMSVFEPPLPASAYLAARWTGDSLLTRFGDDGRFALLQPVTSNSDPLRLFVGARTSIVATIYQLDSFPITNARALLRAGRLYSAFGVVDQTHTRRSDATDFCTTPRSTPNTSARLGTGISVVATVVIPDLGVTRCVLQFATPIPKLSTTLDALPDNVTIWARRSEMKPDIAGLLSVRTVGRLFVRVSTPGSEDEDCGRRVDEALCRDSLSVLLMADEAHIEAKFYAGTLQAGNLVFRRVRNTSCYVRESAASDDSLPFPAGNYRVDFHFIDDRQHRTTDTNSMYLTLEEAGPVVASKITLDRRYFFWRGDKPASAAIRLAFPRAMAPPESVTELTVRVADQVNVATAVTAAKCAELLDRPWRDDARCFEMSHVSLPHPLNALPRAVTAWNTATGDLGVVARLEDGPIYVCRCLTAVGWKGQTFWWALYFVPVLIGFLMHRRKRRRFAPRLVRSRASIRDRLTARWKLLVNTSHVIIDLSQLYAAGRKLVSHKAVRYASLVLVALATVNEACQSSGGLLFLLSQELPLRFVERYLLAPGALFFLFAITRMRKVA